MAEYAVENIILEDPALAYWTKHVLNKKYWIIYKTQWYRVKTHKYPKTVKEAVDIDKENGNTLWWDTIMQEMKKIRP